MGKGEIAPYEQFLLFPQCFQKACFPGASLCGNGLIEFGDKVDLPTTEKLHKNVRWRLGLTCADWTG